MQENIDWFEQPTVWSEDMQVRIETGMENIALTDRESSDTDSTTLQS